MRWSYACPPAFACGVGLVFRPACGPQSGTAFLALLFPRLGFRPAQDAAAPLLTVDAQFSGIINTLLPICPKIPVEKGNLEKTRRPFRFRDDQFMMLVARIQQAGAE